MNDQEQQRAFGVFPNRQSVRESLQQLQSSDFPMAQISLVVKQTDEDETLNTVNVSHQIGDQTVNTPSSVVQDTLTLSSWGFALVGLTSLAIPGVGPILAAGSLGAALVATTVSTGVSTFAISQLVRTLTELGIPEPQARTYSDRLLQGNYFVMAEGNSTEIDRVRQIFNAHGIQNWGVYETSSSAPR